MARTRLICIEGTDCAGKGTMSKRLATELQAARFKFPDAETELGKLIYAHLRREWSAGVPLPSGDLTRGVPVVETDDLHGRIGRIVDASAYSAKVIDALVFQTLQSLNRVELAPRIVASLHSQDVVLDRYWPSGVVFGGNDGIDTDWLIRLHRTLPQPDLFVLLDVDRETAWWRLRRRLEEAASQGTLRGETWAQPDRYEAQMAATTDRIQRYRGLWRQFMRDPREWAQYGFESPVPRFVVIDARRDPEAVYADVLKAVRALPEFDIELRTREAQRLVEEARSVLAPVVTAMAKAALPCGEASEQLERLNDVVDWFDVVQNAVRACALELEARKTR